MAEHFTNILQCCSHNRERHKLYELELQKLEHVRQLIDTECIINERNEMIMLNELSRLHLVNRKPMITKPPQSQHPYLSVYKIIWAGLKLTSGNHLNAAKEKRICPCYMFVMVPSPVDESMTSHERFNLWRFYLCTINNEFVPIAPIHWQSILHSQRFEIERYRKSIYSKTYSNKLQLSDIPLSTQVVENGYYLPTVAVLAGFSEKIQTAKNRVGPTVNSSESNRLLIQTEEETEYMNQSLTVFPVQPFLVYGTKPSQTVAEDPTYRPYPNKGGNKPATKGGRGKKSLPVQTNKLSFSKSKTPATNMGKTPEETVEADFDISSFSNIKPLNTQTQPQQQRSKPTIITQKTISFAPQVVPPPVTEREIEDEGEEVIISDNENEVVQEEQQDIEDSTIVVEDSVVVEGMRVYIWCKQLKKRNN